MKKSKQPEMPKDLRDQLDDAFSHEAKAAGQRVDAYLDAVGRLEPDIAPIDASAFYASCAISAKRQADALERIANALEEQNKIASLLSDELKG